MNRFVVIVRWHILPHWVVAGVPVPSAVTILIIDVVAVVRHCTIIRRDGGAVSVLNAERVTL